jgi:hypothetical protein
LAEQIRTVTREFETGDHAVLHVEGRSGSVSVEGREIDRVQVEATVRVWTDIGAEADDAAALVERAMEQDGNRVIVRAPSLPQSSGWSLLGMRGSRVDYEIRVPLRSAVRVLSRSGKVEIGRVEGRVHSEVLSGRLSIVDVNGEVTLVSRSGSVGIERIVGNLTADVRSGRVKVSGVSGNASIEMRSGQLEASKVRGDLRVRGRSGPVSIEDAGGAVQAHSRCGPFRYRGRVEGDFDIDVHTGPITLEVDPERPFFIDAESRVGPVTSDLPPRRGAGGGGGEGPKVRLRTGTGPIRVTRG